MGDYTPWVRLALRSARNDGHVSAELKTTLDKELTVSQPPQRDLGHGERSTKDGRCRCWERVCLLGIADAKTTNSVWSGRVCLSCSSAPVLVTFLLVCSWQERTCRKYLPVSTFLDTETASPFPETVLKIGRGTQDSPSSFQEQRYQSAIVPLLVHHVV